MPRPSRAERLTASRARPAIDLRHLLPAAVPAQGPRPLCLPFAVGASHEAQRTTNGSPIEALAPEALWWHCTKKGQTGRRGVLLTHVGEALTDTGQPTLLDWPYSPWLGSRTEDPPARAGPAPWRTRNFREVPLAHDGIEAGLEDLLAAGSPIVLVIEVTDEFDHPDSDGHIQLPNLRAMTGDYHAVLAVGVATRGSHGRCLLVRNSWGEWWAAGGYGWLPVGYLEAFAVQGGFAEPP